MRTLYGAHNAESGYIYTGLYTEHFWLHAPLSRFHKWMGSASEAVSRFWLLYPWTLSMVSYRGCQHKKWMPIKHGKITFDRFCFISGVCTPHFIRLCGQTGEKISTQTWTWEKQLKYSTLFRFLQKHEEKIRTGVIKLLHCLTTYVPMIFKLLHYLQFLTIFCIMFCRIFRPEGPRECFVWAGS